MRPEKYRSITKAVLVEETSRRVQCFVHERNKMRGSKSSKKHIVVISQKRDIFILRKQRENTCAV